MDDSRLTRRLEAIEEKFRLIFEELERADDPPAVLDNSPEWQTPAVENLPADPAAAAEPTRAPHTP